MYIYDNDFKSFANMQELKLVLLNDLLEYNMFNFKKMKYLRQVEIVIDSSIYYDYTLCDKPIGLIWEDYEEYAEKPGFVVDMDYMMKGGVKIYDMEDFRSFIRDVAKGIDRLKDERREIRDFANYSTDGKNSKRVVDFIIEQAKL